MTALIRNLATMTRVGVLAPGSDGTAKAVAQLGDARADPPRRASTRSRCWRRCARTRRAAASRGRGTWTPVREIVDALDAAFYTAFEQRRADGQAPAARARRVGLDERAARSPACRA